MLLITLPLLGILVYCEVIFDEEYFLAFLVVLLFWLLVQVIYNSLLMSVLLYQVELLKILLKKQLFQDFLIKSFVEESARSLSFLTDFAFLIKVLQTNSFDLCLKLFKFKHEFVLFDLIKKQFTDLKQEQDVSLEALFEVYFVKLQASLISLERFA